MREIRYADAGMDLKKLGLCFVRKCWMVVLGAAIGAVIGGALYAFASVVPEAEREYRAVSKVYLDFAADETGEVYQHYNGYTWNDLMATDPILDVTMQYLPEGYDRTEVATATKAEILSDVRLLTITVTTHDADRCNAILNATGQSLTALGNTAKEFRQISVIQATAAQLVTADDRTVQAVSAGIVAAVILTLLGMMFYYVLDDRIMTASDLRQVTDAPFIGYAGAGGRFQKDYEDNLAYLQKKAGNAVTLIVTQGRSAGQEADERHGTHTAKRAAEAERKCVDHAQNSRMEKEASVSWETGLAAPVWDRLCAAGGVVIAVEYGKVHAVYLSYVLEQLRLRECRIAGIGISGADGRFLHRYYGRAFGRVDEA